MAINKVVNKSTKSHGAMRNVLEYVLRDEKVKEGYVFINGPYAGETVNYDELYQTWIKEKQLWGKDSGRMYAHNIISFHKDEKVSPEEVLEIGKAYAEKHFPGHQYVISVHQDKDHLHCHIVVNSVSYIDGHKLHQTKHDLERQKEFTNNLCRERGLSVAEKGHHFDGSLIEQGEITAWSKDKYNLLINDSKKSFVAECALAVMEVVPQSASREEFISGMEEKGWSVQWEESRKHIVFQNKDGKKVRDTNIEKTFAGMQVNKEALTNEFTRQNELRIAALEADRKAAEYYAEVESVIAGADAAIQSTGADGSSAAGESEDRRLSGGNIVGQKTNEGTDRSDTEALLRDVRSAIHESDTAIEESGDAITDSRSQSRAVIRTENQSVADNEQSVTREAERRLAEQRRAVEQERAREAYRRSQHHSGPSL